jgi:hypothetical protein
MAQPTQFIRVTQSGPTTIVGFEMSRIPEDERFATVQAELLRAVSGDCEQLVFDLAGVRIIPSQLLGLMAWLCRKEIDIAVRNASHEILETLAFTQLDTIIDVHEGKSGP